jgi:DNA helicase INO80
LIKRISIIKIVIQDFKYLNRVGWQYLVLDEAQAIKSASSQRWKLLLEFKCRGRLLLSGNQLDGSRFKGAFYRNSEVVKCWRL